jgi:hypothetical protein
MELGREEVVDRLLRSCCLQLGTLESPQRQLSTCDEHRQYRGTAAKGAALHSRGQPEKNVHACIRPAIIIKIIIILSERQTPIPLEISQTSVSPAGRPRASQAAVAIIFKHLRVTHGADWKHADYDSKLSCLRQSGKCDRLWHGPCQQLCGAAPPVPSVMYGTCMQVPASPGVGSASLCKCAVAVSDCSLRLQGAHARRPPQKSNIMRYTRARNASCANVSSCDIMPCNPQLPHVVAQAGGPGLVQLGSCLSQHRCQWH